MASYMYPTNSLEMLVWRTETLAQGFQLHRANIYLKVTDTSTEKIVANACWQFPHSQSAGEEKDAKTERQNERPWPEGSNPPLTKAYYLALDAKQKIYVNRQKDYG